MKSLKPNSCFRITYPDKEPIEFRTPESIHYQAGLTQVMLRNKSVTTLRDLLEEHWDHFSEIPCEEILGNTF